MQKVPIFRFWCQQVLPLVYDNSLSYLETLCKVVDKLNEVIDTLNSYSDELAKMIQEKFLELQAQLEAELDAYTEATDAKLAQMQGQMDSLEAQLTQQIADFTAQVTAQLKAQDDKFAQDSAALRSYVDTTVSALQDNVNAQIAENEAKVAASITTLTNYVNAQVAVIREVADTNLRIAKDYTDVQIAALRKDIVPLSTVWVIDPTTGLTVPIQLALDNIYEFLRKGALTAFEYDTLQLTAGKYDGYQLTAQQYDMYGKEHLWNTDYLYNVHSGITGNVVNYKDAIQELYAADRKGGVTAGEYDGAEFTCEQFDDFDQNAFNWDWTASGWSGISQASADWPVGYIGVTP